MITKHRMQTVRIHESQLTADLIAGMGAILVCDSPGDGGVTVKANRRITPFVLFSSEGTQSPNRLEVEVDRVDEMSFDRVRQRLLALGVSEAFLEIWPAPDQSKS